MNQSCGAEPDVPVDRTGFDGVSPPAESTWALVEGRVDEVRLKDVVARSAVPFAIIAAQDERDSRLRNPEGSRALLARLVQIFGKPFLIAGVLGDREEARKHWPSPSRPYPEIGGADAFLIRQPEQLDADTFRSRVIAIARDFELPGAVLCTPHPRGGRSAQLTATAVSGTCETVAATGASAIVADEVSVSAIAEAFSMVQGRPAVFVGIRRKINWISAMTMQAMGLQW